MRMRERGMLGIFGGGHLLCMSRDNADTRGGQGD